MRIIHKPKLEEDIGKCPVCGCVFAYTAADVWEQDIGRNEGKLFIDCPCCDRQIMIENLEPVWPEMLEGNDDEV